MLKTETMQFLVKDEDYIRSWGSWDWGPEAYTYQIGIYAIQVAPIDDCWEVSAGLLGKTITCSCTL